MSKATTIRNPRKLLKLFMRGYRDLKPLVHVSTETATAIDSVVSDLTIGHDIAWIREHPESVFRSTATGSVTCCEHFLGFLDRLHEHMHRPQVFSVSHERALALLYAYDQYLSFTQPFLQWEVDSSGRRWLWSRPRFEKTFGHGARVLISAETNADDPTVFDRGWADPRARYLI